MPYLMCGYAGTLIMFLIGYRICVASISGLRGVKPLTWALILGIVGVFFMALRPFAPQWLSVVAGNELIFAGTLLFYYTAANILSMRAPFFAWGIGMLVASLPGMTYFTYSAPSVMARIFIASGLCAAFAVATAVLMLQHREEDSGRAGEIAAPLRAPTRGMACLQWVVAGQHLVRCILSAIFPPIDFAHLDLVQVGCSYAYMALSVATCCGLVWLAICVHRRQLHIEAHTDSLTGLLNRRAFEDLLDREMSRAHHERRSLVLMMMDIDHFKTVNDTWGHQAGDEVLRRVCRTLQEGLRPSDVLSRYGGEEFVVLLRNANADQAEEAAERLRARVAGLNGLPGPDQITVSVGVALSHVGESPEQFFHRCDQALYRSKNEGRNLVTMSSRLAPLTSTGGPI